MKFLRFAALAAMLSTTMFLAGCGDQAGGGTAEASECAPGAFPPVLTDMDYHQKAWVKSACLTCHEQGVNGAPKTEHRGMQENLKEAKCRTCHVFVKGLKPPETK